MINIILFAILALVVLAVVVTLVAWGAVMGFWLIALAVVYPLEQLALQCRRFTAMLVRHC